MNVELEVVGLDKLQQKFSNFAPKVEHEVRGGLFAIVKKIETDAKRSIQAGGKSGRLYKRRTITHQASAPGQAPASDTGRLVNSINGRLLQGLPAEIRASTKYARFLEFGTRFIRGKKIKPSRKNASGWQ